MKYFTIFTLLYVLNFSTFFGMAGIPNGQNSTINGIVSHETASTKTTLTATNSYKSAPAIQSNLTTRLDSVMELFHQHNNFNGTVLVAQNGEVLFTKGYGYANMEHHIPNGPDMKYRIASNAKQFTSMLVMQQVAEGKMSLDSTINTYIPDYPSPQGEIITIHHLLTHTSGMQHYAGIPGFFPRFGRQLFEHKDFVKLFQELELMTEPGENYSYSSFGYYLLGYILEEVSGKKFDQLLDERILHPLGMSDTGIEDHRKIIENRAHGYDMILDGFLRAYFRDLSTALATGDMYTTPLDMVKWDQALREYSLLDKEYQDLIFEPELDGYGYGWRIGHKQMNGNDSLYYHEHTGGTNGFTSIGTRLPDDGYYILVYCNTRPGEIRPISQQIVNVLYGKEVEFERSIPIAAARILEEEGLQQSLDFLKELAAASNAEAGGNSTEASSNDVEDELELSHIAQIGSDLMLLDRNEEAVDYFSLGTRLFPDSARAQMLLGDAWHAAGEKDNAVTAYARALLLDPTHNGTLQRLQDFPE
ncbi:MAG: serine hydrolase [Bacteroidales bacterium]